MNVKCFNCAVSFEKADKECKRAEKLGRRHFCSRACSAVTRNNECSHGNIKNLNPANRRDAYSSFRAHLACAKRRAVKSKLDFSITLEDLRSQWNEQNGKCPYTGWLLVNPATSDLFHRATRSPDRASLDRKNCKVGYVPSNIEFVSMIANFAKNDFTSEQMITFCKAVAVHNDI